MSETLTELIDRKLSEGLHRKIVDLGYWCGRCQVEAIPDTVPIGGGNGWCPFCGMNPLTHGPEYHAAGTLGHGHPAEFPFPVSRA